MEHMFKHITSFINIEMYSKNGIKLLSMKSTFEGCTSLLSVNIRGFNLLSYEFRKSLFMKKLFYNTS